MFFMKECISCGAIIGDNVRGRCPICFKPATDGKILPKSTVNDNYISEKRCKKCHSIISNGILYCPVCSTKVDVPVEAPKKYVSVTNMEKPVYDIEGVRGRSIQVYPNRCVIKTKAKISSFITGNASDGEKTIYYVDCIGVQFKKSGLQIGYLQLETASSFGNNKRSNFFNENTFTFDANISLATSNEKMEEVAEYIKGKIDEIKTKPQQQVVSNISVADEILKFKELLDLGIITQEEFDVKKKQLLGL